MYVYLVVDGNKTLAAFCSKDEAIDWATTASRLEEQSPYNKSSATVHYVVQAWLANYTDWRQDVHVYGDGKVMTQS